MNSLPASIEAYLLDAEFSSTEIHILKKLIEEDALTLRQIAAKTGKSTGVLDTAMDKLIRKNIIVRESINESAKYSLTSLDAIKMWMESDIRLKREELTRRHQSFENFLSTLTKDKTRPEMQHFSGVEGIEQVYNKVLNEGKEMLQYVPVICSAEDDPIRDFRVEYFRERRRSGIFSRIIAHNTPLGRRYQSRDPFEYRQTILVSEDQYPFSFEKIIVGNTVTCINFLEKRACFMRYPELAQMERANFEGIWKQEVRPETEQISIGPANLTTATEPVIPLKIKTLSRLREFFLGKESLISMGVLALIAGVITFGLYNYTSGLNLQRMKDKTASVAATGAAWFSLEDIDALRKKEDWKKPEWEQTVQKLTEIRENNSNITFAYIIRKISDTQMEFVSDSHSLNPFVNTDSDLSNDIDANSDGKIEPENADKLQWPGQAYPEPPNEAFLAYNGNTASEIYTDQWGTYLTGYAPILNYNGKAVAVLAIDMKATELDRMNAQTFAPVLYFLAIFSLFAIIRLAAFNKSLFREFWNVLRIRYVLLIIILCAHIAFFATVSLYYYTLDLMKKDIGNRLMSIAATSSTQFDPAELDQFHFAKDMQSESYQKVHTKLNEIRSKNPGVLFVYIMKSIEKPYLWEFIADADANWDIAFTPTDFNNDGELTGADENSPPGVRYYAVDNATIKGLEKPTYSKDFFTDQWGEFLSGYAPIRNKNGTSNMVLGVDMSSKEIREQIEKKFLPPIWFLGLFTTLFSFWILTSEMFKKKDTNLKQLNMGICNA